MGTVTERSRSMNSARQVLFQFFNGGANDMNLFSLRACALMTYAVYSADITP